MKRTYIVPKIGIQTVHTEQSLLLRFSQVDNGTEKLINAPS